jgi:hypothetical protein
MISRDPTPFSTEIIPFSSNPSQTYQVVFCTKGAVNPDSAATDKIARTIIQGLPAPSGSWIDHKTQTLQRDKDGFVIPNSPHTFHSYFDEMRGFLEEERAADLTTDKENQHPLSISKKKANPTESQYRLPVLPEIPFIALWYV